MTKPCDKCILLAICKSRYFERKNTPADLFGGSDNAIFMLLSKCDHLKQYILDITETTEDDLKRKPPYPGSSTVTHMLFFNLIGKNITLLEPIFEDNVDET